MIRIKFVRIRECYSKTPKGFYKEFNTLSDAARFVIENTFTPGLGQHIGLNTIFIDCQDPILKNNNFCNKLLYLRNKIRNEKLNSRVEQ